MKTIAIALAAIAAGGHALRDQGVRKMEQELSETTSERRSLWWWLKDPAEKCAHYEHMVEHYQAKVEKYCEPEWIQVIGAACSNSPAFDGSGVAVTFNPVTESECKAICSGDSVNYPILDDGYNFFQYKTTAQKCDCYTNCDLQTDSQTAKEVHFVSGAPGLECPPGKQFNPDPTVVVGGVLTYDQVCK